MLIQDRDRATTGQTGWATPTTRFEQTMLVLVVVALPAENHFIPIPGISILFLLFGIAAVYVTLSLFSVLLQTIFHPVFLATYVFIGFGFLMEMTHENASYGELMRMAQMVIGGILVACLCRDWPALKAACYGYLCAGLYLAILLFLTSYGALSQATTTNFQEASQLRAMAFEDNPFQSNLNSMAFGAGQGAAVALAWALTRREALPRLAFMAAGVICLIGSFLPLSRGGVAITIAACATIVYAVGLRQGKAILITALLCGAVLMWVPQSVWTRMSFTFEEREGKVEGRALVYGTALENVPEYLFTGVGAGNFWSAWGLKTAFAHRGRVSGAHNCFLQVTLYWGIFGLLGLILILWQAYRCIPYFSSSEAASLSLIGIAVSLALYTMVIHSMYAKEFSLGLGMLVGGQRWIWPQGFVWSSAGGLASPQVSSSTLMGDRPNSSPE